MRFSFLILALFPHEPTDEVECLQADLEINEEKIGQPTEEKR
jgi:hypothetical protein